MSILLEGKFMLFYHWFVILIWCIPCGWCENCSVNLVNSWFWDSSNWFYFVRKFYSIFNAEHVWLLKEMALSWIWFLLLPKLTIWFLDEPGWTHQEKWLWQIWLQGTKLFSIFNLAVGLGMQLLIFIRLLSLNLH